MEREQEENSPEKVCQMSTITTGCPMTHAGSLLHTAAPLCCTGTSSTRRRRTDRRMKYNAAALWENCKSGICGHTLYMYVCSKAAKKASAKANNPTIRLEFPPITSLLLLYSTLANGRKKALSCALTSRVVLLPPTPLITTGI